MDAVLESGIFHRAPILANFFRYICECYFDGKADQLKEYCIAVEALGRSADFDPKKDSIVRVEAHRLRKRLRQYYLEAGATHPVHIDIPNGQYVPQFIAQPTAAELIVAPPVELASPPQDAGISTAQSRINSALFLSVKRRRHWARTGLIGLFCIIAVIIGWRLLHRSAVQASPAPNEVWQGLAEPVPAEFRMLAGYHGAPVTDRQGHTWNADAYYVDGWSSSIPHNRFISGQPDPTLLRSERSGTFHYDIPLRNGTYELHLYFAETEFGTGNPGGGGEGSRMFDVLINGKKVLRQFDPLAEVGAPNRLDERVFKDISPAKDGKLHLTFNAIKPFAFLNAIEILASAPGRIHPVRIVAQESPVTDADGRFWSADEYFCGGTTVMRTNPIFDAREKALYQGERYGNFAYRIPLAPGKYRLTLHFAETWFGTPQSNEPALGSRIFNVFANGVALLRNFEIAKEAPGVNCGISKSFDNLEPNALGALSLEFIPVKNYAEVNAIEVVETD